VAGRPRPCRGERRRPVAAGSLLPGARHAGRARDGRGLAHRRHRRGLRRPRRIFPDRGGAVPGSPAAHRATGAVAGGGRQSRLRDPCRSLAAGGDQPAGRAGTGAAAAGLRPLRRGLPRHRQIPALPGRAQGHPGRPGRRPDRGVGAGRAGRGRGRPGPVDAHPVRLPAGGRPGPGGAGESAELDRQRRPARRGSPWIVLGLLCLNPAAVAAYDSTAGTVVLAGGAAACVAAYRAMLRIGRLPAEERVLR
jgi:hypothetical protein